MDYKEINRKSWNQRVSSHYKSEFYDVEGFINGGTSLKEPELAIIGEIKGKSILHLQCHFGQDSISLARMGAKVTGIDLSDEAIEKARELNPACGTNAEFVVSDVYDLPGNLEGTFDIVFTSYGTIGWLPDLDRWAEVINHFLKPGGSFVFAEFHPVVWMFDDQFEKIGYNYFKGEAIVETQQGTYADRNASIEITSVSWNHGLGEVITSLLQAGLNIRHLEEFNYSPYNAFAGTEEFAPGKFRIAKLEHDIPMMYTLKAEKPS